jgi:regulator of PEP synthase PpsR (kinase-PPPase family)
MEGKPLFYSHLPAFYLPERLFMTLPAPMPARHTVFFVSDGTGITAETLGHSLLSQFEDIQTAQVRMPFIDSVAKATDCVARINAAGMKDGNRAIVISTLVNPETVTVLLQANALILDFFGAFYLATGSRVWHEVQPHHWA